MTLDEFLMGLAFVLVLDEELGNWDIPDDRWLELHHAYTIFESQLYCTVRETLENWPQPEVSIRDMAKTLKIVGL